MLRNKSYREQQIQNLQSKNVTSLRNPGILGTKTKSQLKFSRFKHWGPCTVCSSIQRNSSDDPITSVNASRGKYEIENSERVFYLLNISLTEGRGLQTRELSKQKTMQISNKWTQEQLHHLQQNQNLQRDQPPTPSLQGNVVIMMQATPSKIGRRELELYEFNQMCQGIMRRVFRFQCSLLLGLIIQLSVPLCTIQPSGNFQIYEFNQIIKERMIESAETVNQGCKVCLQGLEGRRLNPWLLEIQRQSNIGTPLEMSGSIYRHPFVYTVDPNSPVQKQDFYDCLILQRASITHQLSRLVYEAFCQGTDSKQDYPPKTLPIVQASLEGSVNQTNRLSGVHVNLAVFTNSQSVTLPPLIEVCLKSKVRVDGKDVGITLKLKGQNGESDKDYQTYQQGAPCRSHKVTPTVPCLFYEFPNNKKPLYQPDLKESLPIGTPCIVEVVVIGTKFLIQGDCFRRFWNWESGGFIQLNLVKQNDTNASIFFTNPLKLIKTQESLRLLQQLAESKLPEVPPLTPPSTIFQEEQQQQQQQQQQPLKIHERVQMMRRLQLGIQEELVEVEDQSPYPERDVEKKIKTNSQQYSQETMAEVGMASQEYYLVPLFFIEDAYSKAEKTISLLSNNNSKVFQNQKVRGQINSAFVRFYGTQEMLYKRFNHLVISYVQFITTNDKKAYREFSQMSDTIFSRIHMFLISAETGFGKSVLVNMLEELGTKKHKDSYIVIKIPANSSMSAWMDGPIDKAREEMGIQQGTKNSNELLQQQLNRRLVILVMEEFDVESLTFERDIQRLKEIYDNINNSTYFQLKGTSDIRVPCPILLMTTNNTIDAVQSKLLILNQYNPVSERLNFASFDKCHPELLDLLEHHDIIIPMGLMNDIYHLNSRLELKKYSRDGKRTVQRKINAAESFKLTDMGIKWLNNKMGKLSLYSTDLFMMADNQNQMQRNLEMTLNLHESSEQEGLMAVTERQAVQSQCGSLQLVNEQQIRKQIHRLRQKRVQDFFTNIQILSASVESINEEVKLGLNTTIISQLTQKLKQQVKLNKKEFNPDSIIIEYSNRQLQVICPLTNLQWMNSMPLQEEINKQQKDSLTQRLKQIQESGLGQMVPKDAANMQAIKDSIHSFKLNFQPQDFKLSFENKKQVDSMQILTIAEGKKDEIYLRLVCSFIKFLIKWKYTESILTQTSTPLVEVVELISHIYRNLLSDGILVSKQLFSSGQWNELGGWVSRSLNQENSLKISLIGLRCMMRDIVTTPSEIEDSDTDVFQTPTLPWSKFQVQLVNYLYPNNIAGEEGLGQGFQIIEESEAGALYKQEQSFHLHNKQIRDATYQSQ